MPSRTRPIIINKSPKTRKSGHVSVSVRSEPLEHHFDETELAREPAQAIRDHVEAQIRAIREPASSGTIAKRRRVGRTGTRLFNDAGKLAKGLFVAEKGGEFETRAPADRLTGPTAHLVARLLEVAKISPRDLLKSKKVRAEIRDSVRKMIRKRRR